MGYSSSTVTRGLAWPGQLHQFLLCMLELCLKRLFGGQFSQIFVLFIK
jgi:hypothetical protein